MVERALWLRAIKIMTIIALHVIGVTSLLFLKNIKGLLVGIYFKTLINNKFNHANITMQLTDNVTKKKPD